MPVPHDYDAEIKKLQDEVAALQDQLNNQKPNIKEVGGVSYWFIGDENTWVEAQGPKGKDGTNGKDGEKGDKGDPGDSKEQNAQNWWSNDFSSGKFVNASVTGINVGVTGASISVTGVSTSVTGSAISCYGMIASGSINKCDVEGTAESFWGCFTFGLGLLSKAQGSETDATGNKMKNSLNKNANNVFKLEA